MVIRKDDSSFILALLQNAIMIPTIKLDDSGFSRSSVNKALLLQRSSKIIYSYNVISFTEQDKELGKIASSILSELSLHKV